MSSEEAEREARSTLLVAFAYGRRVTAEAAVYYDRYGFVDKSLEGAKTGAFDKEIAALDDYRTAIERRVLAQQPCAGLSRPCLSQR